MTFPGRIIIKKIVLEEELFHLHVCKSNLTLKSVVFSGDVRALQLDSFTLIKTHYRLSIYSIYIKLHIL